MEGDDFFGDSLRDAQKTIAEEDLPAFEEKFNRKNVLDTIEKEGFFAMNYHLLVGGKKARARIKAAIVEEEGTRRLIFGVISAELKKSMAGDKNALRSVSGS
ncbi:MAG: hypothetical protein K6B72_13620 [Lachnospiraceae bacterium]|nr:hypothetical protein [Lachnospiraceae bacterium]